MIATLLCITLALAGVLAARKPARRWFGAEAAFVLWLLPLLLGVLSQLPALPLGWSLALPVRGMAATHGLIADARATGTATHGPALWWAVGSVLALLRLALLYSRLLRQSRPLRAAMLARLREALDADTLLRLRLHPAGPALLWAPRSRILLPADFLTRYTSVQRRLVLRHECMHLRRGDATWSLLAELAAALLWFHPLAWLALPRFRLDQELACDAAVLRRTPQDRADYAHTLLHSAGVTVTPVLIPWLAEPQLKERLHMIQHHPAGALRRRIGFIALAALMASGAFVAEAATHAAADRPASQDLRFALSRPPHYPQDAITRKQQGTVVLQVLVDTDGRPRSVKVDPVTRAAPSLVKAASDAAMQWRFHPATRNGKPIESYAKVPVNFDLHERQSAPAATPITPSGTPRPGGGPASSNT